MIGRLRGVGPQGEPTREELLLLLSAKDATIKSFERKRSAGARSVMVSGVG